MANEERIHFQALPPLFVDWTWSRRMLETGKPDRPARIFLASGSDLREEAVRTVLHGYDLQLKFTRVNGPSVENGPDPTARAVHKVEDLLSRLVAGRYFERNPGSLTLLIAADSRNRFNGANGDDPYRDKAQTQEQWKQFGDEWKHIATDGIPTYAESGYAALVLAGNMPFLATQRRRTAVIPPSIEVVDEIFRGSTMFERTLVNAHGMPTADLLRNGQMKAVSLSGRILLPVKAVQEIYGASPEAFERFLSTTLVTFAHARR